MFGVWVVPYMHAPSVRSHTCSSCRHWRWLYIYIYRQPTYIVLFQINVYYLWISYHSVKYTLCMCASKTFHCQWSRSGQSVSSQTEGARTYRQQAGQADKCMETHFCEKTFTAFNFINDEIHWCAYCDFKTALQTTSLQCSQQFGLTNGLSTNGLPESTTCSSSNYTHCSQLLLIHRMVAYSNHSPVENKMATRAMLIRDAFMLPMEPLTVRPYKEQGKEDSLHYHSNVLCSCHPTIHVSLYVKSMKTSDRSTTMIII